MQTTDELPEWATTELAYLTGRLGELTATITWLRENVSKLVALGLVTNSVPGTVYVQTEPSYTLTRGQLTALMLAFPGKWAKRADGEVMTYTLTCGLARVVVKTGDLPASCRVVYEERTVPANTIKVPRIVCDEPADEPPWANIDKT